MPTFYGNSRGISGPPNTKALNSVKTFSAPSEFVADKDFVITGFTYDSTGAILGGVTVELLDSATEVFKARVTSDPVTGAYTFFVTPDVDNQCLAYKVGTPDIAGITVNTLRGV